MRTTLLGVRSSRRLVACAAIAIGVVAGTGAPAFAAQSGTEVVVPDSATGCSHNVFGTPLVCTFVHGTGLHVDYATVTNVNAPTGLADILNTGSGVTHQGPRLAPGQAWRLDFNRNLKDGAQICGSIAGLDTACVTIHN